MRVLRQSGQEQLSEGMTFMLKIWVILGKEQCEQRFQGRKKSDMF